MTRAVIELSGSIGSLLPVLTNVIEGCRYNPEEQIASFYRGNACIILEPEKMTIYNVADEDAARNLVEDLKNTLRENCSIN